ncbi:hypothetical protein LTS17_007363 [Exophiala oligosperma]
MEVPQFEPWDMQPMVSYRPSRSRSQLESENEELLRKVQVLQAQCQTLAARNQELAHLYLQASCQLVDVELPDCSSHLQHSLNDGSTSCFMSNDMPPLDVVPPQPSQALQGYSARDSRHRTTSYTRISSVHSSSRPEPQLWDHHYLPNLARMQNAEPSALDGDFFNDLTNQYCWQSNEWEPQATSGHYCAIRTDIINDNVLDADDTTNAQLGQQPRSLQSPDYTLQDSSMWLSQPPDTPTKDFFQDNLPPLLSTGSSLTNANVENDISNDDDIQVVEGLFDYSTTPIPTLRNLQVVPDLRTGYNSGVGQEARCKLDQYITTLYQVLSHHAQNPSLTMKHRAKLCAEGVLWVVREAWPEAAHFWKTTASFKGFFQSEMWRNFPNEAVYGQMHPSYCPTPRQLTVPHSPLIDWLPWPELREKLIEQQDNFDVDLVCKIAIQNVVAHRTTSSSVPAGVAARNNNNNDRSSVAQGSESTKTTTKTTPPPRVSDRSKRSSTTTATATSFRVWDLCLLEEKAGFCPPVTSSTGLVYTPASAEVKAIEKAYGLEYSNFETQKLHPRFFETFPTLFVASAVSHYVVQDLPVAVEVAAGRGDILGAPQKFSPAAGDRLQTLINRVLETLT